MTVSGKPTVLFVPGLGGSGAGHWQTLLERDIPNSRRVEQSDWNAPRRADWIEVLKSALDKAPGAVVVAHSLGCILLAHVAAEYPTLPIRAALLVAPADVESVGPAREAVQGFGPIPMQCLPFPSTVVTSADDPYVSVERATVFAAAWGGTLIDIGRCGHINVEAGFGPWPDGRRMLERLIADATATSEKP
jgi:predicted alpha/beta hydrolase family esterase